MKKLLLTSDGLTSPGLGKRFIELVNKNPRDIKVLFVPTASDAKRDIAYLERKITYFKLCEERLADLGIQKENWFWLNINNISIAGDISSYDAMYVCGGNTFYLLHEIKRTGFDKTIIEFVNRGRLYIGESAGSIIVAPDILMSAPFDANDIGLKDTTGLNLTEKIICPHYNNKGEDIVNEFEEKNNCKVLRLKDGQAWEETDTTAKIIE